MDDPIFDPWAIGEPPGADATDDDEGAPTQRAPARGPSVPSAPVEAPPARRWVAPPAPVVQPNPVPSVTPAPPSPAPSAMPAPPSSPQPLLVRVLRETVLLRLEELRGRLEVSGHGVVLDDRSDGEPASIRFRFEPRRGAFDEATTGAGSVLEVAVVPSGPSLTARLWLDPLAESWSEEVTATADRIDERWIDRVILDFVAKTLNTAV